MALSWHNRSNDKTTKSRHSLYDAPLISGLYSRLALKHGGRVGESRREQARAGERDTSHSTEKILSIVR